jgi:hypothetical protein
MTERDLLAECGRLKAENAKLMKMIADLTEFIGFKLQPSTSIMGETPTTEPAANVVPLRTARIDAAKTEGQPE